MNQVESQQDGLPWSVDESDYDSDVSLSDSDGSEGEVPVVTRDVKEIDAPTSKVPGGKATKAPASGARAGLSKSSSVANSAVKDGSNFIRGWKPVIDGKVQVVGGEASPHKARVSSMQQAATSAAAPAVSQKHSSSDNASPSPAATGASEPKADGNESDSDVRRVPEISAKGGSASGATSAQPQGQSSGSRSRKRGGAPADKEHKRLKRLLRNRVSAQQARERKKAYLSDLEIRSKELHQRNEELEERVSTLQRENFMLRQIVRNTTSASKKAGNGANDTEA